MSQDQKQQVHDYLIETREAVIWKAEGLSEYDVRRPLTRTGTNLLGLIKHLSIVEAWYFGKTFERPFVPHLPWWDADAPEGADMWANASESRQEILDTYQAAIAHADETIRSLDLDAPGDVPWWPRPNATLHAMLIHVHRDRSPRWTRRHPARATRRAYRDASRQSEPGAARWAVVGRLPITNRIRRALRCFEVSRLADRSNPRAADCPKTDDLSSAVRTSRRPKGQW